MKDAATTASLYALGIFLTVLGWAVVLFAGDPMRGVELPVTNWHEKPSRWRDRW